MRKLPLTCAFAIAACALLVGASATANASPYVVTMDEVGPTVVATGSGAIDTTGLTFSNTESASGQVFPDGARLLLSSGVGDFYFGSISGPTNFGSGGVSFADIGNGPVVFINGTGTDLAVPTGYTSDSALGPSSDTFDSTYALLGITPGTYIWTWGSGADQSFTLDVETPTTTTPPATPLPAALPMFMAGAGLIGLLARRRKRKIVATT